MSAAAADDDFDAAAAADSPFVAVVTFKSDISNAKFLAFSEERPTYFELPRKTLQQTPKTFYIFLNLKIEILQNTIEIYHLKPNN